MSGISAQDFLSTYEGNEYPKDFLGAYEPVECLSHNAMGETLLVRDRAGTLYVAKCYTDPNLRPRRSESALLGDFKHEGLPALVAEYEGTGMLAVVREYMPGEPLDRLNVPLGEKEALDICIKVCALLGCLHAQKPPVIHRDVKPQNIVMDGSGSVSLIDFGIARAYDEAASADTVSMGTREFASPEQFGFAQTDSRSDVYSLGVVLLWLLTGSTDTHRAALPNRRLARVIRKATAFSPEKRYRSANALGRALARADGRVGRAVTRTAAAAAALLCALTGGFALGRYTDLRPAGVFLNQYVTFAEPCVENAVRLQLGKAEDEPIRAEELEQVEQLYLYGDQTAATLDAFYTLRTAADSGAIEVKAGEIATLSDLSKLKNLRQLFVGSGSFTDLSVLKELPDLEMLGVFSCPVTDVTPIGGLTKLRHLTLSSCRGATDLSPLAGCASLKELVIVDGGATDYSFIKSLSYLEMIHMIGVDPELYLTYLGDKPITEAKIIACPLDSLSQLSPISGVQRLILENVDIDSLDGIERLTRLTELTLAGMPWLDLAPLGGASGLTTLFLYEDMRDADETIPAGAGFHIVYR